MGENRIGFECILPPNNNLSLDCLLCGIDLSAFRYVVPDGAYIINYSVNTIPKNFGNAFYHNLCNHSCIEHLILLIFPLNAAIVPISTYYAYVKSECQVAVLYYDCSFLEVYAKNIQVLERLFQNVCKTGAINITYKTEENDGRTEFYV